MMENILQTILVTSCMGIMLSVVLLALKPLLRNRFSAGWYYYIWLVVLLAMVLPVKVNWADVKDNQVINGAVSWVENHLPLEELRQVAEFLQPETEILRDEEGHRLVSSRLQEKRIREIAFERKLTLLSRIWLTGAVLLLAIRLISYAVFLKKIRKQTEVISCPEVLDYTKRKVTVRAGEWVHSPLLLGVLRPILLLPAGKLTEEQLKNVLSHEMTHLKRNDMLVKWFVVLIKSIHWFNPFVYVIDRQIEQECEISCDITATGHMSGEEKKAYADTILMFLMGQKKREFSLSMGMAGTKGLLKKRFLRMKTAEPISRGTRVMSGCVTAALVMVSLVVSGNLMNQTFPYSGDKYMWEYALRCEDCEEMTIFKGRQEVIRYASSEENFVPGEYIRLRFQCPECLEELYVWQLVRELTQEEKDMYSEWRQKLQEKQ